MSQKVIIFGFPHCGSSILKSIIGHIDDVEEIYEEVKKIDKPTDKQFILCKFPFTEECFFDKEYKDYIKIFIIRNPLFVFSSLNKRYVYNLPLHSTSVDIYIDTIKKFIEYQNNPEKNVYTITYEDLFDNNFQKLRTILDGIGMKYGDTIFDNTKYNNIVWPGTPLNRREIKPNVWENQQPNNQNHAEYRTWQINQPFTSKNDISKLDLTEIQIQKIMNDTYINYVYRNSLLKIYYALSFKDSFTSISGESIKTFTVQ